MQANVLENDTEVKQFSEALSLPRLTRYLQETSGNKREALKLYLWNSQLSQSLYLPLQIWEVLFRNKIDSFLRFRYGGDWPRSERAMKELHGKDAKKVSETIQRLEDRHDGKVTTDMIVADLTCGFWVSQITSKYNVPYGWKSNIKFRVFTDNHKITRQEASEISDDLLDLRNRVAHHEPVFHLALPELRDDLNYLVEGMCGVTASILNQYCSFDSIWASRP